MTIELTATIAQQREALERNLAALDRELESLNMVTEPLVKKIRNRTHVRNFLVAALRSLKDVEEAYKAAQGPEEIIPW